MPDPQEPAAGKAVECRVCGKEVPRDEAKSAEGEDYVVHFCGYDCYEKWRKGQPLKH